VRLQLLELDNFCQHRRLRHTFVPGLTGILGPCGSGKSNVMGAIRYALTGKNQNAGRLDDNISQYAEKDEPSGVLLAFSHHEVQAEVSRSLRSGTATLKVEGRPTVTGATNVNREIMEILGIEEDILHTMCLVAQDDIFGFLAKRPAQRLDFLQRLFQLQRAEEIHKFLWTKLGSLPTSYTADVDGLRQRRGELQEAAEAAQAALREAQTQQSSFEESREHATQVRKRYEQWLHADRRWRDASTKVAETSQQVENLRRTSNENSRRLEAVEAEAEALRVSADEASGLLHQWQLHRTAVANQATLQSNLDRAKQQLALAEERIPPPKGYDEGRASELHSLCNELRVERDRSRRMVQAADSGMAECPTCGSEIDPTNPAVVEARAQLPNIDADLAQMEASAAAFEKYEQAIAQQATNVAWARQAVEQAETQLEGHEVPPAPDKGEMELRGAVTAWQQLSSEAKQLREACSAAQNTLARQEGELAGYRAALEEAGKAKDELDVTAEADSQAEALLRQAAAADETVRQAEQSALVARERLDEAERAYQAGEEAKRRAEQAAVWAERLTKIRDVFHREAAPRFAIQEAINRLATEVNGCLQRLDVGYRVEATQGMTFTAIFPDGRRQPAERLSEGQRVALALSFCLAVNTAYAADLGFLMLDEPTRSLDEHLIRGFDPILSRLRELATSRNLQCGIITHERTLEPLFDDTLDLT